MSLTQGELRREYGQYIASYKHGDVVHFFSAGTQREAVLGLWDILNAQHIACPRDFVLTGELHEEQLVYTRRGSPWP